MLKFGIEIEFYHPDCGRQVFKQLLQDYVELGERNVCWNLGTDRSVKKHIEGLELRSPILYEDDLDEVVPVVKLLQKLGCKTTHTTGLHVHVSTVATTEFDFNKMLSMIEPLKPVTLKSRYQWCDWDNKKAEIKYRPIRRLTYNHVEFRLWNGSLNLRHIMRSIRQSLDISRECIITI